MQNAVFWRFNGKMTFYFFFKKNSKLGSPVDFPGPCSAQNQPVKASQGYWMVYVDERNYGRPTLLALKVGAQNNECLQLSVFDHPVAHYNIIRSRIWNTQKKISKKKFKKTAKKLTCRHCNCSCVHDSVLKPVWNCEYDIFVSRYSIITQYSIFFWNCDEVFELLNT